MKLSALYQIFLDCQSVTTDSRNCPDGSLFIALKGESFNGEDNHQRVNFQRSLPKP